MRHKRYNCYISLVAGHSSSLFREYLLKLFEIDTWRCKTDDMLMVEKLELRVDEIAKTVEAEATPVGPSEKVQLQVTKQSFATSD